MQDFIEKFATGALIVILPLLVFGLIASSIRIYNEFRVNFKSKLLEYSLQAGGMALLVLVIYLMGLLICSLGVMCLSAPVRSTACEPKMESPIDPPPSPAQ